MSRFILPHLQNRPVTLKRYPDEATGQFFYEKDAPAFTPPWVQTFPVWRHSGESQINYIVVSDAATLVWAAEIGTLEFHPFLARTPDIMRPTEVVFDLDPGEEAGILDCAHVALLLRELLDRLKLKSFAKVSGSKGIQVYVPLNTPAKYSVTQPFAKAVAEFLEREHRDIIVAHMERAERHHKVFIDWSQNADYKTTVAVYSLRAKRRHPYVSMAVSWNELEHALATEDMEGLLFRPDAAIERLERIGDLFAEVETLQQRLPSTFISRMGGAVAVGERSRGSLRSAGAGIWRQTSAKHPRPLQIPQRSAQGGRRRFILRHERETLRFTTEIAELLRSWLLPSGLPSRKAETGIATEEAPPNTFPQVNENDPGVEDFGICELIEGNYDKGFLRLFLKGAKLQGEWLFTRERAGQWRVYKPQASIVEMTAGVPLLPGFGRSGKPMGTRREKRSPAPAKTSSTQRKRKKRLAPLPNHLPGTDVAIDSLPESPVGFVTPMECRLVNAVPEGASWLYELKLDGYRAITVKKEGAVQLLSRHGNDLGPRFSHIKIALQETSVPDVVLDGEIVALDQSGRPSFQELQNTRSTARVVYYVFDVLNYSGRDLQRLPLSTRKHVLQELAKHFVEPVRLSAILEADASTLVTEVTRRGLEGIVAKRTTSAYESAKRSGEWQKFRTNEKEEFLIGGYLPGRNYFDALLTGRMEGKKLKFVKKLRNGFVPETRREVFEAIKGLRIPRCPFVNLPEPKDRRGALDAEQFKLCVWVKPEVKCEVEFTEWTAGGRLRHAAFRRLVE